MLSDIGLRDEPRWFLNGEVIQNVESLKVLGIQLDRRKAFHSLHESEWSSQGGLLT